MRTNAACEGGVRSRGSEEEVRARSVLRWTQLLHHCWEESCPNEGPAGLDAGMIIRPRSTHSCSGSKRLMFAWTDSREMELKAFQRSTVRSYLGGVDTGDEVCMTLLMM